jgi:hypothetical protein
LALFVSEPNGSNDGCSPFHRMGEGQGESDGYLEIP